MDSSLNLASLNRSKFCFTNTYVDYIRLNGSSSNRVKVRKEVVIFKIKNEVQRFAKTVLQKKNKRKEVTLKKGENDHDFSYFIVSYSNQIVLSKVYRFQHL